MKKFSDLKLETFSTLRTCCRVTDKRARGHVGAYVAWVRSEVATGGYDKWGHDAACGRVKMRGKTCPSGTRSRDLSERTEALATGLGAGLC